jgi:hypothetical protein
MPPETCPNCGADVPRGVRACPECGADERTGWSEAADGDRLGLPRPDFDYDAFIREEFGPGRRRRGGVWWLVALLVLAAVVALLVF